MIDHLLIDFEAKHSDFQITNFIVGGQGSEWFQYGQCLREIKGRRESLENAQDSLLLLRADKKSLRRKIKLLFMGRERRKIFLKNELRRSVALSEDIREVERELKRFVEIAVKLKKKIGDIDERKRKELDAAAWIDKARQMAAIEILTMGRPSKQTFEFILSLPKKQRAAIIAEIKHGKPEKVLKIGCK
jgi:hypothetical protein